MSRRAVKHYATDIARKSFLIILIVLPGSLLSIPIIIWVSKKLDVDLISTDFKIRKKPAER